MQNEARILTYTRRDLLRAGGALAATAAAANWLRMAPGAARQLSAAPLHLGTILPQADAYPHLGESIVAGLELFFTVTAGRPIALLTAAVDPGGGYINAVVERLLADGPLDFLVGMVTPTVASALHERLAATNTVFVNATVGANVPRDGDRSPLILHSSLGQWQGSWALGGWAAAALGKRALLLASLYDSGYDASYTFRLGLEARGGEIVATQVTTRPVQADDLAALLASPEGRAADFLYAAYSGSEASAFLRAYAALPAASRVPLVGPPFLADAATLRALGDPTLTIHTASSWSTNLDTPANQQFMAAYQARTGRPADSFAALGYDTAGLIAQVAGGSAHRRIAATGLAAGLVAAGALGPRGALTLDERSGVVTGAIYRQVVSSAPSGPRTTVAEVLAAPGRDDRQIAALRASVKTGWVTPYLCG